MIERKQVSIHSDEASKTETGFRVEGNLQEVDHLGRLIAP